ncbi:unnamed protein product [Lampetra fluviatilis]
MLLLGRKRHRPAIPRLTEKASVDGEASPGLGGSGEGGGPRLRPLGASSVPFDQRGCPGENAPCATGDWSGAVIDVAGGSG